MSHPRRLNHPMKAQRNGTQRWPHPPGKTLIERAVRICARDEFALHAIVRLEPSHQNNLSVWLQDHAGCAACRSAAGNKRSIQRAIRIKTRKMWARSVVKTGELAADQNLSV